MENYSKIKGDEEMLDCILNSCNYVVNNSKYVTINYKILDLFIDKIDCKTLKHWLSNNPYNLFDLDISTMTNLMLLFDSIDYSFWGSPKWNIDTEIGKKDGSDALLYIMIKYVKENKSLDFTKVTFEDFESMLTGNIAIPLLRDRYQTLVEISSIVNNKMNGNFYEYIKDIRDDTKLFDIIINNFPSFKDERTYNGKKVYFYKLAQLLASDILHLREMIENIDVDYSHLVGCADYKIPQTMRALEILKYDNELSQIVDNKTEIDCSSKYEVEIRASMIVVIEYIKNKLKNVNSIDINDYFFTESKKVKDISKPYHLCRNNNY